MVDGIPNRPLYFYQKDIIDSQSQYLRASVPPMNVLGASRACVTFFFGWGCSEIWVMWIFYDILPTWDIKTQNSRDFLLYYPSMFDRTSGS